MYRHHSEQLKITTILAQHYKTQLTINNLQNKCNKVCYIQYYIYLCRN